MEISDSKFQSNPHSDLKKRLDALHYCHPVTPHSAILVETLLNDIIASNEKLQILQKENSSFRADLQSALSEVRMYQSEITRLGTENNRLHLEMMKTKEQASESQEKWRVSNKKLENEKNDLKTLNEIHKVKIQELEIEKEDFIRNSSKFEVDFYELRKRIKKLEMQLEWMMREKEDPKEKVAYESQGSLNEGETLTLPSILSGLKQIQREKASLFQENLKLKTKLNKFCASTD